MRWKVEVSPPLETLGRVAPRARGLFMRWAWPVLRRAFRPQLRGLENLPVDRPFLLVANHSAGLGLAEIFCFAGLHLEHRREEPLAGFAHPLGFKLWPFSSLLGMVGAIPSSYDAAYRTLGAGVPLLVFPGGDHETMRPLWRANDVDFGGRRGFLKIAREAGVPIIPMGISGSHYTAPVLIRSRALAWLLVIPRLVGIKRWGISALGLLGAVALGMTSLAWPLRVVLMMLWLTSPLSFWPIIPWTLRFRVGQPLGPEALFAEGDLGAALEVVERTIERLVRAPRGDDADPGAARER